MQQSRVFDQLAKQIENISGARVGLLNWSVVLDESVELEAGFPDHLVAKINRFWDGVRSLPYSDVDIIMGLAKLIAFGVALRGDLKNTSGHHWEAGAREVVGDTLLVEFGADDGSYSRCYVSASKIEDAIRFDIRSYVSPEYQVDGIDQPVNVLRMARVPQQIFDAARLNSMFVTDIVPIQVLMRDAAIFYSPARLTKFGLA